MIAEPSRFYATPAEINEFLRQHVAEDTLLRYQQAIGGRAVTEAAKDIRMESHSPLAGDRFQEGMRFAADHIDPLKGGGPWLSTLVNFGPRACPVCDGTGGDHQIGCQQPEGAS